MRTDIEDWEKYNTLLENLVARAVLYPSEGNRSSLLVLDLLQVAEQFATRTEDRALALKYGDVNAAMEGLAEGTRFEDATRGMGALGLLVDIAARAMVADAKRKPRWRAYVERNKDR